MTILFKKFQNTCGWGTAEGTYAKTFECIKKKKKLYGPFSWIGFNCLKARVTLKREFTFYH